MCAEQRCHFFPVLRIHHSRTWSPKLFYSLHYFLRHLHVIFHIYLTKCSSCLFLFLWFFHAMVLLLVTDQEVLAQARAAQQDGSVGFRVGAFLWWLWEGFLLSSPYFPSFPTFSQQPLVVVSTVPPFLCCSSDTWRVTELVWVTWDVVPAAAAGTVWSCPSADVVGAWCVPGSVHALLLST